MREISYVFFGSTFGNKLLQLATLKFIARQLAFGGGNMGKKALQLAKQQCCATSWKKMLPYYLALKGNAMQYQGITLNARAL